MPVALRLQVDTLQPRLGNDAFQCTRSAGGQDAHEQTLEGDTCPKGGRRCRLLRHKLDQLAGRALRARITNR
jgi:hypothetical protein